MIIMGCYHTGSLLTPSRHYVKMDESAGKGETVLMRNPCAKNGLTETTQEGYKTLQEVVMASSKKFANNQFLGTRERLPDGKLGQYRFKTFGEIFKLAQNFGSGLLTLNLVPEINEYKDHSLRLFGVYSKNTEYWGVTDVANSSLWPHHCPHLRHSRGRSHHLHFRRHFSHNCGPEQATLERALESPQ